MRFLYKKTLRRRDIDIDDLPLVKAPKKLPVVLSQEEVARLIEAAPNLRYRTLLMLLYATGLRRAEAVRLKISDIDTALMLIHVHQGKGSRDRDLPLTPKLLEALRQHWRACKVKPRVYLFPSRVGPIQPERPTSDKTVWHACHEAALRAGLTKRIGPHTLRHSFATHTAGSRNRSADDPAIAGASAAQRHRHLSCTSPAGTYRRRSIRWIRSRSATFTEKHEPPENRQGSIAGQVATSLIATGRSILHRYQFPPAATGIARSVRPMPANHGFDLANEELLPVTYYHVVFSCAASTCPAHVAEQASAVRALIRGQRRDAA